MHPDPNNNIKLTLLKILSEHLNYATGIILTPNSYVVLTRSYEGSEKIFQATCSVTLKDDGFDPFIPTRLRAKRTITLIHIDDPILLYSEPEIK